MMFTDRHRSVLIGQALVLAWMASIALADPPDGYYASIDATDLAALRTTLHAVIDDHTRFPSHRLILDGRGGI